jgi:protein kinase-like protein
MVFLRRSRITVCELSIYIKEMDNQYSSNLFASSILNSSDVPYNRTPFSGQPSGSGSSNSLPLDPLQKSDSITIATVVRYIAEAASTMSVSGDRYTKYLCCYPTIGQGATFNVKKDVTQHSLDSGDAERLGFILRDKVVVHKRLRRFPPLSVQERSRQLQSFLLELRCLCHGPLQKHPNIITLLGFGFEPGFYDDSDVWPVLTLEYAEFGSLADLQERNLSLRATTKANLCLDVALGIQALHECDIIHGDVKSENVLVFPHKERGYIGKLADFGYSVLSSQGSVSKRGTVPWQAPEVSNARSTIPSRMLMQSDV